MPTVIDLHTSKVDITTPVGNRRAGTPERIFRRLMIAAISRKVDRPGPSPPCTAIWRMPRFHPRNCRKYTRRHTHFGGSRLGQGLTSTVLAATIVAPLHSAAVKTMFFQNPMPQFCKHRASYRILSKRLV